MKASTRWPAVTILALLCADNLCPAETMLVTGFKDETEHWLLQNEKPAN